MTRLFRLSVALLCGLTLAVAAQGDWTRDASQFLVHWAALTAIYLLVLLTAGVFRPAPNPARRQRPVRLGHRGEAFRRLLRGAALALIVAGFSYAHRAACLPRLSRLDGRGCVVCVVVGSGGVEYGVPLLAAIAVRAWSGGEGR